MKPPGRRLKERLDSVILDHLMNGLGDDKKNDVYVVQVGANDGHLADPVSRFIRARNWRGLLIEPVPHFFAQLQKNYAGVANVELLNAACGPEPATLPFWQIAHVDNLPSEGARGLSSFRRDVIRKHFRSEAEFEKFVERVEIEQFPLDMLLAARQREKVDILYVDAEGYDYQVMKGFDLATYRPDLVIIEHIHLPEPEASALRSMMYSAGYNRMAGWQNCYYYRRQAFSRTEVQIFDALQDVVMENV